MAGLLAILRGEAFDVGELDVILALAEQEHVLPWTVARIRARAANLPPDAAGRLAEAERAAAIAAFYWSSELKGLLRAFAEAGIAVIPLKGPCLAERLYGGAALRSSRDLDLLVGEADVERAKALLGEVGFTATAHADDYHQPWRRGSTVVELHHEVENPLAWDFGVEEAWSRAEDGEFQGVPILRLAEADELLFLCLHGVRHRFERMSLVLDLMLAIQQWSGAGGRAERPGWRTLRYLGWAMARRMDGSRSEETAGVERGPGAEAPLSRLALFVGLKPHANPEVPETWNVSQLLERGTEAGVSLDAHLEAVADRLWERLLARPAETLDWAAAHAFYLELERPGTDRMRRRMRHWRILSTRVIEADYAFAARFGLRRRWQARLLRPLRLLLRKA